MVQGGGSLIDYSQTELDPKQKWLVFLGACTIGFMIGWLFYKHILPATILAASGCFVPRIWAQFVMRKRKEMLKQQFKQALHMLSSALAAGKSVENAFQSSLEDLRLFYPAPRTYIVQEWERIVHFMQNGDSIESALLDFSHRCQLEDIQHFTDIFMISKRSGGNMVEIIGNTARIIGEKIEMQQEVSVMLSKKKFESKIIFVFPFILIALLGWGSPEYMAPLYEGIGRVVMTGVLLLLIFSYWLHLKIMQIDV